MKERGLVSEESDTHQYRFRSITDPDSGRPLCGNRTAGGEVYRAVSGGGVKGKREGAGSLRIAAAQAVVK